MEKLDPTPWRDYSTAVPIEAVTGTWPASAGLRSYYSELNRPPVSHRALPDI